MGADVEKMSTEEEAGHSLSFLEEDKYKTRTRDSNFVEPRGIKSYGDRLETQGVRRDDDGGSLVDELEEVSGGGKQDEDHAKAHATGAASHDAGIGAAGPHETGGHGAAHREFTVSREPCSPDEDLLRSPEKCLEANKLVQKDSPSVQGVSKLKSICWTGKTTHKYPELPGCFIAPTGGSKGPAGGSAAGAGTIAFSDCGLAVYYKTHGNRSDWYYLCEKPGHKEELPEIFYVFMFLAIVALFGALVTGLQHCLVWTSKLPRTVWMLLCGVLLHVLSAKVSSDGEYGTHSPKWR